MPFTEGINGKSGKSKAINVGEARKKGEQLQFAAVNQKRLVEMLRIYAEKLQRSLRRDISLMSAELERYVSSHLAAVVSVRAIVTPTAPSAKGATASPGAPVATKPPAGPNPPPASATGQSTSVIEEYIPANHYVRLNNGTKIL